MNESTGTTVPIYFAGDFAPIPKLKVTPRSPSSPPISELKVPMLSPSTDLPLLLVPLSMLDRPAVG
jgi:hypothetical protein